jgi:hypothetical protein
MDNLPDQPKPVTVPELRATPLTTIAPPADEEFIVGGGSQEPLVPETTFTIEHPVTGQQIEVVSTPQGTEFDDFTRIVRGEDGKAVVVGLGETFLSAAPPTKPRTEKQQAAYERIMADIEKRC